LQSQEISVKMSIVTPCTQMFKIQHPIMLAGMNVAAGPDLAAAVTNAGGLGVVGGVGYTVKQLREIIHELKDALNDKNAPFGVDLLLPQVGGSARKTNKSYTGGNDGLNALIDVIIEEKAALFVSAVGVPPKEVIERLHKNGIAVMNMVGAVKHAKKALDLGVDLICGQGGEGGGHTGDVPTTLLIPELVELCRKYKSPLTGQPVQVIAAGGIYNGKSLAAMLSYGATGVWVGTRFICAEEAGASRKHQEAVITAGDKDTIRTIIFTGRPLRVRKTPFIMDWEENKQAEIKKLTSQGTLPVGMEPEDPSNRPFLIGKTAAVIHDVKPAKAIVDEMVAEAVQSLKIASAYLGGRAKL